MSNTILSAGGEYIHWHTEQLFIRPNHMFILLIHEFIITAETANEVHCLTGILQEAASVMSGLSPPLSLLT